MSYDFQLFHVPPGADPLSTYERQLADRTSVKEHKPNPLDLSKEQTKQRLTVALTRQLPTLELHEIDYAGLAKVKSIDETEARRHYRGLELTDNDTGLQVSLFDESAAIAMPYWRLDRQKAAATLRAAWQCLQLLEREGGFSTYDSQVGKILNLDSDFDTILSEYAGVIETVDRTLRQPRRSRPR